MKILIVLLFALSFQAFNVTQAQGCSDAGFCTMGHIKPLASISGSNKKQKISLLLTNGIGDENVYVFTPGLQYDNRLNKNLAIQAKVTANYASGNLGTATGLGDLYLSASYTFNRGRWKKTLLLGGKVFLNNSNLMANNMPLPMQYQSSLGTVDVIGGLTVANQKWLFATAIQLPLTGRNRNTFLPEYFNKPEALKYAPTNDFKRRPDVLLRAGYTFNSSAKWTANIGLLGIYHLGKDTYINGNISNLPIELKGSDGLTLNGTAAAWYQCSNSFSIGLTAGVPFVVRDIRPDGLTRKFVLTPELIFHF